MILGVYGFVCFVWLLVVVLGFVVVVVVCVLLFTLWCVGLVGCYAVACGIDVIRKLLVCGFVGFGLFVA